MSNLLTITYWFTVNPAPLMASAWKALIALVGLLIIMAMATAFLKVRPVSYRGRLKKLYAFFLSNSVIGLLIIFFNYEAVPFFMARFWLAAWAILMVVWIFFIWRKFSRLPKPGLNQTTEDEKRKYLPH